MSSGRGRGVSNAPAWMTRPSSAGGGGGPPPPPHSGRRPPSPERDQYGRMRSSGGPPPPRRRHYDDEPPLPRYNNRGPLTPRGGRHRGGGGGRRPPVVFRSYEEECDWVEERRRKRLARKSLFDVPPTPEQLAADAKMAAMTNFAATDFSGINFTAGGNAAGAQPQQTRHARRLYIGHLPAGVNEDDLHVFFRQAIESAMGGGRMDDDPILSVYINHERRFCFLEFKTIEMASACMALDGINVMGRGKVKVKRPNDYNPTMVPPINPAAIPQLDVSRLGIVSGTVADGPNKVFIGGLHYHLTEDQVMELLQAFGKIKAFHLVKEDPDATTSKGYCFVEYADPNVTPTAVMGLNGMDLGGGKTLTARVAAARNAVAMSAAAGPIMTAGAGSGDTTGRNIINGYDVEQLVDAAMGLAPMPAPPTIDPSTGLPTVGGFMPMQAPVVPLQTPVVSMQAPMAAAPAVPMATTPASALDIANAALAAAYGPSATGPPPQATMPLKTRILVLLNMVMDEDLATDDDYNGLSEEVREECSKFGRLVSMKIPRLSDAGVDPSAVKKIFLEYATVDEAARAEQELAGRTFGSNVVQASYFSEEEYAAGRLK